VKRGANTQRRAREQERQAVLAIGRGIAIAVSTKRAVGDRKEIDRMLNFSDGMGINTVHLDAKWIESESVENIADGLRLAADILEQKPMDGRTFSDHDCKIATAVLEAMQRVAHDHPSRSHLMYEDDFSRIGVAKPTFSEFLEVYREQNPRVKVEERTLRRALKRLNVRLLPDKRGRPKEK
jgi:hypothetical protein